MPCKTCNTGGGHAFNQCAKCGQVWCKTCIRTGAGGYPKETAGNRCPYCKVLGKNSNVGENEVVRKTHKHLLR